jgi:hypothetical protein
VSIVVVVLLSWRRPPRTTPGQQLAALDPEVTEELRQFRGEFG